VRQSRVRTGKTKLVLDGREPVEGALKRDGDVDAFSGSQKCRTLKVVATSEPWSPSTRAVDSRRAARWESEDSHVEERFSEVRGKYSSKPQIRREERRYSSPPHALVRESETPPRRRASKSAKKKGCRLEKVEKKHV